MTVVETRHQAGTWTLRLAPDTPASIISLFDTAGAGGFGTIVVTDGYRSGPDLDPTTLLSISRYTGVFRKRERTAEGGWAISGPGLLGLIGSDNADQASHVLMNEASGNDDHGCATWAGLIIEGGIVDNGGFSSVTWSHSPLNLRSATNPSPNPLKIYGVTNPADTRYLSRRDLLEWLTVQYPGVEYRVFPDATISVGPRGNIYDDSIRPLVSRSSGRDRATPGIPAGLGGTEDLDDYAYRVYVNRGGGDIRASDAAQVRYRDPFGRDLTPTRQVDANIPTAWAEIYADALYTQTVEPRRTVQVTPGFDVDTDAQLVCGGFLNVYDPDQGIWNPDNGMMHRGGWVFPTAVRLESMTWPVARGMGVYFRWWPTGAAPRVVDLTQHVVYESGAISLEVGSPRRPFRRRR